MTEVPRSYCSTLFESFAMPAFWDGIVKISSQYPMQIRCMAPFVAGFNGLLVSLQAVGAVTEHTIREIAYLARVDVEPDATHSSLSAIERYQVLTQRGLYTLSVRLMNSVTLTLDLIKDPQRASLNEYHKYDDGLEFFGLGVH